MMMKPRKNKRKLIKPARSFISYHPVGSFNHAVEKEIIKGAIEMFEQSNAKVHFSIILLEALDVIQRHEDGSG